MQISQKTNNFSFKGTTQIYAMTDSHQETRKTCGFLSKILKETENKDNVLFLHSGDFFKGIYPKDIERDSYIKLKETKPNLEIVTTLGNNDFGFNKESLDYLINTVKKFKEKGIKTVCANIFTTEGSRPEWIKPYTVVERDGDKTFITGFCIDNINTSKFGIVPKKQTEVIDEIQKAILKEKPDNVIFLNHDYMSVSQDLVETCKKNGINVNVVIGGHDHDFVEPNRELNIYYPESFSDSMYKMDLVKTSNSHSVKNIELIKSENLKVEKPFTQDLEEYEKESGLLNNIAPSILNLTKQYSKPCPLGSFLADAMKSVSNSDIAFFSTGFLMKPLEYNPNSFITNYLFKKTMIADTPIKTVELNAEQLKEVFQHALKSNGYGNSNPKFLQCSNNIKIEGKNNPELNMWDVKQIYIDKEPILDENSNAIPSTKKYKCAIDSYIAEGGQGFSTLSNIQKKDVIVNNETVKINQVLMNELKQAPNKYKNGSTYPSFELNEL